MMKSWVIVLLIFLFIGLVFSGGVYLGRHEGKHAAINQAEMAINDSLRTGRPFMFHNGNVAIVKIVHSDGSVFYKAKRMSEK